MKKRILLGAIAIALPFSAASIPAAQATAITTALPSNVVASYQLNEAPGSTVLVDSSGHGYNGTIGSELTLNGSSHTFPAVTTAQQHIKDHQRLDIMNSPAALTALNPGAGDWSVTIRLQWTVLDGDINVTQKGQGRVAGGRWHMATPKGHIKCVYVDEYGSGGEVDSWSQPRLTGTGWHTVTCAKVGGRLQLVIDGVTVATGTKKLGPITNTTPMTIGGKLHCKCDYWTGQVDWVTVNSG